MNVKNTPFDFTSLKPIGTDLYADHEQLLWNKGYNHCYILKDEISVEMLEAASLYEPVTGRNMTVMTDLPAVLCIQRDIMNDRIQPSVWKHSFIRILLLIRIFLPA